MHVQMLKTLMFIITDTVSNVVEFSILDSLVQGLGATYDEKITG